MQRRHAAHNWGWDIFNPCAFAHGYKRLSATRFSLNRDTSTSLSTGFDFAEQGLKPDFYLIFLQNNLSNRKAYPLLNLIT